MKYTRLTLEERYRIQFDYASGKSIGSISRALSRCFSTVSREIKRHLTPAGYKAEDAHKKACNKRVYKNQQRRKLVGETWLSVVSGLKEYWSPQQISGWLRKDKNLHVSHEIIYQRIWQDKKNKGKLYTYLRRKGKKYCRRGNLNAGRGCIPGRIDIDQRPKIVEEKSRIGDWELDTIVGVGQQGYVVSMVERCSKFTKLALVPDAKAETVADAIEKTLSIFSGKVLTLTSDNGKEFSQHQRISSTLKADFFFAKPYHSWERGLNEHTNGLVRQFLPKGTNFLHVAQEKVQWIENLLNNRPRAVLGFQTPQQVFSP